MKIPSEYMSSLLSQFSAATTNSGTRLNCNSRCVRSFLYSLGMDHRKHRLLYCCVLIQCCRDMFTAQLHSNEHSADPQRTLLATHLLLLCDVTPYVTRSSTACVQAINYQWLFLCLHSSCFQQIRHNIFHFSKCS
jgi:hypothetical protein